jgi:S-adenosylmethionine hydrolase
MQTGGRDINDLARTFGDRGPGELFVIVGSSGYLEVVMNQRSAAKTLGVASGAPVDLSIY